MWLIICLIISFYILTVWFKVRKTKSATISLIASLGGIDIIFAPLVEEIRRVFICDNVSYSWNQVIVCDAPKGTSALKSDITFRLRRTLFSYVITYASSGKSLPQYNKTWTFADKTSFNQIWHIICNSIGVSPEIQPNRLNNIANNYNAKTISSSELPNITNLTVKFNFLYSFRILPQSIEEYMDEKKSILM